MPLQHTFFSISSHLLYKNLVFYKKYYYSFRADISMIYCLTKIKIDKFHKFTYKVGSLKLRNIITLSCSTKFRWLINIDIVSGACFVIATFVLLDCGLEQWFNYLTFIVVVVWLIGAVIQSLNIWSVKQFEMEEIDSVNASYTTYEVWFWSIQVKW